MNFFLRCKLKRNKNFYHFYFEICMVLLLLFIQYIILLQLLTEQKGGQKMYYKKWRMCNIELFVHQMNIFVLQTYIHCKNKIDIFDKTLLSISENHVNYLENKIFQYTFKHILMLYSVYNMWFYNIKNAGYETIRKKKKIF